MSDEELDALFRRGAEAYPDEMPPEAWARMETKLDTAAHTQQLRRKIGRFFAGELVLIALLLWQVARLANPAATTERSAASQQNLSQAAAPSAATASAHTGRILNSSPVASIRSTQPVTSAQPAALGHLGEAVAAPQSVTLGKVSAPASILETQRVNAEKALTKKSIATGSKLLAISAASKRSRTAQPGARSMAGSAGLSNTLVERRAAAHSRARKYLAYNKEAETVESLDGRVALLEVPSYSVANSLRALPDSVRPLAMQQRAVADSTPPRRPAPRPPYRVVVGLLAGPSASGVRTAQSARLGLDYGLTLEYRFTTRLRLRGGLLSSQKHYLAASTDYQAPAAWQWYPGTYDLVASCRVTEIPLDLRYDVVDRKTFTVFTSLGLNSLLMRDERYSYDWTMNGQTSTKSAQVLKGSNHFLSVLNLAVGFEKPLGTRWSVQAEPFWQVPLGGVGAGKVRLTSAGASFSLKYGLLR